MSTTWLFFIYMHQWYTSMVYSAFRKLSEPCSLFTYFVCSLMIKFLHYFFLIILYRIPYDENVNLDIFASLLIRKKNITFMKVLGQFWQQLKQHIPVRAVVGLLRVVPGPPLCLQPVQLWKRETLTPTHHHHLTPTPPPLTLSLFLCPSTFSMHCIFRKYEIFS